MAVVAQTNRFVKHSQIKKNKRLKMAEQIEKVSIIISRGSLEGVYPGLIMANGARMEGIEATVFFTFFGLDAIIDKRMDSISVATVGNSAMRMPGGLKMPTLLGAIPGMSAFATSTQDN